MDKCKREKEKLYENACTYGKNYYTSTKYHNGSYLIKRSGGTYIREYGFETLPDLKRELEEMWQQDEIMQGCMQTVLVAAFKLKPTQQMNEKLEEVESSMVKSHEKLSPFIYNF